jgi:hypothetical protein
MAGRRLVYVALVPPIAPSGYLLGFVMLLVEDLLLSILLGLKTLFRVLESKLLESWT